MLQNRIYQDGFQLRLPEGMRDHIKANAAENGRSMNAEIVFQLKRVYEQEKEKAGAPLTA